MAPRGLQILILDDDMDLCRELRSWLEEAGHAVSCRSAQRFLLTARPGTRPDLLIYGLPKGTGEALEQFRRVAALRGFQHLPIIVASEDSGLEYEMLDVFDFQVRPFDRQRFLGGFERLKRIKPGKPLHVLSGTDLQPFRDFLLRHTGLHFGQNNLRLLERGLLRRMLALQIARPEEYLAYLEAAASNYDELNKLLGLLTVGETSFFRYRSHREALLHFALPRLLAENREQKRLRVWSAGCSTGEEPYSLAILLLEHFPELADWDVQILATDINKSALRLAREGIYRERSLRQTDETLRRRYFTRSGEFYRLAPRVRNLVRFGYLNLQKDLFPAAEQGTGELDLLFCRNVLIYFELGTIRRIVEQFGACLKPTGFLFMGHSETMQNVSTRFTRHHQQGTFFYQLKAPEPIAAPAPPRHRAPASSRPRSVAAPPAVAPAPPSPDPDQLYAEAMNAFDHEAFAEADQLLDRALEVDSDHALALVGKGLLAANQGDDDAASRYCAKAIARNDLLPEAYLLRGLVLDTQGLPERSLVEFQKVLWLNGSFIMAHYLMAKLYARLGQPEQSARSLRNTIACLERMPGEEPVPFSGGLSRSVFLEITRRERAETETETSR